MEKYIKLINEKLNEYLPSGEYMEKKLLDSMRYSLNASGKRIRPVLTLYFSKLCGGDIYAALPYACAVEMIHTYSLIHDDLPCMDNDDYRRGQPSNHKIYGEDIALLAGDALQSLAFENMLNPSNTALVGEKNALYAAYILAKKSGTLGMVGGQTIDLENEGKNADLNILQQMDIKKTSNLIEAACMMGCIVSDADKKLVLASEEYARSIGIAFQIMDDILDVTSSSKTLGKPVGSDKENNKSTYVSLLGLDKCREIVNNYTNKAVEALDIFEGDTSALKEIAYSLSVREK